MALIFGFFAFLVSRLIDYFLLVESAVIPSAWIIFSAVFFAPFIETLIFQKCGFIVLEKIPIHNFLKIILISAIFSVFHFERDWNEQVELFFVGMIFTGVYFFYKDSLKVNSFKMTANTHLIYNLITIMYIYFEQSS